MMWTQIRKPHKCSGRFWVVFVGHLPKFIGFSGLPHLLDVKIPMPWQEVDIVVRISVLRTLACVTSMADDIEDQWNSMPISWEHTLIHSLYHLQLSASNWFSESCLCFLGRWSCQNLFWITGWIFTNIGFTRVTRRCMVSWSWVVWEVSPFCHGAYWGRRFFQQKFNWLDLAVVSCSCSDCKLMMCMFPDVDTCQSMKEQSY